MADGSRADPGARAHGTRARLARRCQSAAAAPRIPGDLGRSALGTRLAAERSTSGRLLAAERDTNARLRSELDGVRREIGTWPSLHAKIVSPFGRTAPALDVVPAAADVDPIGATVRRATGTLRQIAGLMMRLDTALSHLPSSWPVRAAINSEFGHRRSPWTGDAEFHPYVLPGRAILVCDGDGVER